jgi:hypothetical protein
MLRHLTFIAVASTFIGTCCSFAESWRFSSTALETLGTVKDVSVERHEVSQPHTRAGYSYPGFSSSRTLTTVKLTVEFPVAGRKESARFSAGFGGGTPYGEGSQVPVLYDPANPSNARLSTGLWGDALFCAFFCLISSIMLQTQNPDLSGSSRAASGIVLAAEIGVLIGRLAGFLTLAHISILYLAVILAALACGVPALLGYFTPSEIHPGPGESRGRRAKKV